MRPSVGGTPDSCASDLVRAGWTGRPPGYGGRDRGRGARWPKRPGREPATSPQVRARGPAARVAQPADHEDTGALADAGRDVLGEPAPRQVPVQLDRAAAGAQEPDRGLHLARGGRVLVLRLVGDDDPERRQRLRGQARERDRQGRGTPVRREKDVEQRATLPRRIVRIVRLAAVPLEPGEGRCCVVIDAG